MLVLTRKTGDNIVIDGHIKVTVVSVKGDKVRIGVEAPPSMRVDRGEIHKKILEAEDAKIAEDLKELQGNRSATF